MRIKRKALATDLSHSQELVLLCGPAIRPDAFTDEAAMRAAWFRHREGLLAEVNPTTRPWGLWEYEVREHPDRRRGERDSTTMLRLNVPLTPFERSELLREQPPKIPDAIPPESGQFWRATLHAVQVRRDWHSRENRAQEAGLWQASAERLEARIRECGK